MIIIDNKFDLGDIVFSVVQTENKPMVVTKYFMEVNGGYRVVCTLPDGTDIWCYEQELTKERVIV